MKTILKLLLGFLLLSNCTTKQQKENNVDYDKLHQTIQELKVKHNLTDFGFDTEYIYNLGDLSALLKIIVDRTIREKNISIIEKISADGKFFIATLSNQDSTIQIYTETDSDWLSDDFMDKLYEIPKVFKSDKRFQMINPAIGLTGQDAWYFCGTEENLKKARQEGLPLVTPGEDPTETEEFRKYSGI